MIIGLTGTLSSGKGEIAKFLKEKGFVYLSLSDELRQIAMQEKIPLTRKNLQDLGNKKREEKGAGVLAELVYDKIINQQYIKAIVDGIRNPAEIEVLKKIKNFSLIAIDATKTIRFKRMLERNRESDPKTLEDFLKVDARDLGEENEKGQQVRKCMDIADFSLINDGSLEEVGLKVKKLYEELSLKNSRPSWDEYFMKQAYLAAERSTCRRHSVGAVIVKDKRTMTTGYNGAASGAKDCLELGCLRDELKIPSGTRHEICRAVHAEQNAILQAGWYGINIKGAIMYCTHTPCIICAKLIANSGLKEIISCQDYPDDNSKKLLTEVGISLRRIDKPILYINSRA